MSKVGQCRAANKKHFGASAEPKYISDNSNCSICWSKLSGNHSGRKGWKSVNTTRMATVSLEKDVTKDMKTKSVKAERNALTLAVQRGTLEIVGTSSSVDTVSSVIPVPTHT